MRWLLALLLSLGSGLGMGLLTYDLQLPLLALIAWAPAVIAQHTLWPERWRGVAMGTTWFAYLAIAFAPRLSPEIGPLVWVLPLGIGLLVSLADRTKVQKSQQTGYRLFWWQEALTCTAVEIGRSFIPAVGTWTMAGYGLTASDGWRTMAGWVGVTGLSLAVWACNFAIAYLVLVWLKRAPWQRGTGALARFVIILCLAVTLQLPAPAIASSPTLRVAAIQTGFDLYVEPWSERRVSGDPTELSRDLLTYGVTLTREAAAQGARLIVWPEGFLRIVPHEQPEFKAALEALARETDATLAIGYAIETPEGRQNEVALLTPTGEWAVTAKEHHVPWAESGSATRGQVATVMVDGAKIGAIICYDADFTDVVRDRALDGLNLLVAPAHDWPAIGGARALHVRNRAAENRLPIVMADWQVGSVLVDGAGQVRAEMDHTTPTRGVLIADLPLSAGTAAPYSRLGDLAGWLSIAGATLAMLIEARLRRTPQQPDAAPAA